MLQLKVRLVSVITLLLFTVDVFGLTGDKILIISSYSSDYQWANSIVDGITLKVKAQYPDIEPNVEYLSSERFPESDLWVDRINMFLANYEQNMPRAIVLISDEAWMAYRNSNNERFANIPLFLCAIKPHSLTFDKFLKDQNRLQFTDFTLTSDEVKPYNATAVIREMNMDGYLDLINNLIPEVKDYCLISDNRFYGIYIRLLVEKYMKNRFSDRPIQYLDARFVSTDSMLLQLGRTTSKTGILLTSWLTGTVGFEYSKQYTYESMTNVVKAPIFITNDIGLNTGCFLGGYFTDSQFWGERTGDMIVRAMGGARLSEIPIETYKDTECRINFLELNRFKIPHENLPSDVIFVNRPESVFEEYSTQFIVGGILAVLIILSYIYVLDNHFKLKKAQKSALLAVQEAELANVKLVEIQDQLKVALKKAEAADRLKSAFISNMDHEIRSPLNAIIGFSNLIVSIEDKDDRAEAVAQINDNSEKLLHLVKSILDLSQLEAGLVELNYSKIGVDSLFQDTVTLANLRCSSGVEVKFVTPVQPLAMVTDPTRVATVLGCLLDNAMKFTLKGSIEIGYLKCDQQRLEFYVQDSGVGIKETDQMLVFERFFKVDPYSVGAGLGLSIAKIVVESLGGQIGFTSEPGVGSRFWFRLKIDV